MQLQSGVLIQEKTKYLIFLDEKNEWVLPILPLRTKETLEKGAKRIMKEFFNLNTEVSAFFSQIERDNLIIRLYMMSSYAGKIKLSDNFHDFRWVEYKKVVPMLDNKDHRELFMALTLEEN